MTDREQPEPVAWINWFAGWSAPDNKNLDWSKDNNASRSTPLYTAPPRNPQDDVGDRFAHRLALMLECAMLDPKGTWDAGHQLLEEYRQALLERDRELGIGHVSALGKD